MSLCRHAGTWARVGGVIYCDFQTSGEDFSKASFFRPDLWGWSSPPNIPESLPPLLHPGCRLRYLLEVVTLMRRRRLNFKGQKREYQEIPGFRVEKMKC